VLLDEVVERLLQHDQQEEAVAPEAPPSSTSTRTEHDLAIIKALVQWLIKSGAITISGLEQPGS
jgi:hypothetical protein